MNIRGKIHCVAGRVMVKTQNVAPIMYLHAMNCGKFYLNNIIYLFDDFLI